MNPAHAYDTLFSAKYCKRGLFRLIGGSHYETTMLNALIEKIVVHEKTIGEDGEKEQTVDIYYRFVGKID